MVETQVAGLMTKVKWQVLRLRKLEARHLCSFEHLTQAHALGLYVLFRTELP